MTVPVEHPVVYYSQLYIGSIIHSQVSLTTGRIRNLASKKKSLQKMNVTKNGKSPKKISAKNQNVQNAKYGLFEIRRTPPKSAITEHTKNLIVTNRGGVYLKLLWTRNLF